MEGHFTWKHSSENFESPIPKAVVDSLTTGSEHLKSNPSHQLTITGWHFKDEIYNGPLADLGIARANKIKKLFLDKGVNAQQLKIASKEQTENIDVSNLISHGVDFSFNQQAPTELMKALLFAKSAKPMAKKNSKKKELAKSEEEIQTKLLL